MENKQLIFLCGFMGCGKSTHGKALAKLMGYHFIDLDTYTENKYDKSIVDLFEEIGEQEFRNIETQSLTECIADNMKTIISLGGGTPCFNNNINLIKQAGSLIYLKMDAEALYKRVFGIKGKRPLLEGKESAEMKLYIEHLLNSRQVFYNQATIVAYNNNLITNDLAKLLQEK